MLNNREEIKQMKQSMHLGEKENSIKKNINCSFSLSDNSVESKECSIEQGEQSLGLGFCWRSEPATGL